MRLLHSPSPPPLLTSFAPRKTSILHKKASLNYAQKPLQQALSTGISLVLSLGLLVSAPNSILALESPSLLESSNSLNCPENEVKEVYTTEVSKVVSNERIVEEAWQIVNDSFLNTSPRSWSPESWLKKKDDILSSSIQTRSKAHDIIKRMLASLGDPYTRFLSPEEFSKMARYDMTGIGVNLRDVPDGNGGSKLKVLGLLLDGPAHSAGVRQGDELVSVNGVNVRNKSAFEASSLLLGPSGTFVNIMVKHGNCGPVQSIDVERQSIAKTPVFYRLEQIESGSVSVGYVRLKEFNALARKDLVTAIKRLEGMGASSFVLDLRDNLGGLVQAGIEIAKLFLNEGDTVISTVGRDPQYRRNIVAEAPPLITAPVIVLVNKKTASASEIVATALHDNCRAVLVGDKTYGKLL
ncbi:PREDICTED: carboxyl-terminal-processing peptidase 1, chloroplastic isoform X2 [Nicotiana attenuata]|uniref:carboxyl-terminal-processing peptidase 1, chloroplastic isoform X2 n=1 Tax=Nicotiana attenuata TaxID=49451 RepID=UPI000905977B|nr:PREDICTED: carboxyl-terminal-processing peptidase 1, chloroplastic isoform X2 [Nicotiana attenuata]